MLPGPSSRAFAPHPYKRIIRQLTVCCAGVPCWAAVSGCRADVACNAPLVCRVGLPCCVEPTSPTV
eukprot:17545-Pyramimonas_sp.AAC.1